MHGCSGEFLAFHLRHPRHLHVDHIEAISQLPPVEQKYIARKLLAAAVAEQLHNPELVRENGGERVANAALQWYANALNGRIVEKVMHNYDWLSAQILPTGAWADNPTCAHSFCR